VSSWQVMKHLDLVIKRLDVMAQPTGTGKAKKKADPRLIELLSGIRKAKQDLKAKAHDVVESLAGLEEGDRAIQWNSIAAGYIEVSCSPRATYELTIRTPTLSRRRAKRS